MLYLIEGTLCGLVIYWWSSDQYSWPMECDLCFRPASVHPNFLAMPEANEWSIIKIKWLFLKCLVLKHHFWNLTFEVHHSLSSLLQASLYSTREKVQVFLLYCKDQIANQGQSLRFQVSSFNVHFFPYKVSDHAQRNQGKSVLPPLLPVLSDSPANEIGASRTQWSAHWTLPRSLTWFDSW